MNLRDLPVLDRMEDVGPADPFFDLLVLVGPVVVVLDALFGRNPASVGLAAAYVAGFVAYLGYKAATRTAT